MEVGMSNIKSRKYAGVTFAAITASALLLTSCAGGADSPDAGTSMTIAVPGEPTAFDPQLTGFFTVADLGRPIFETLMTTDSDGFPQPMLADSYEVSDDGLQTTFTLREGLKFHDGTDLTADDVVDSMTRWTENTDPGTIYFPGATWTKVDDLTVRLDVTAPSFQHMLQLASRTLNFPAILPSEVLEEAGLNPITEYIGSGPYELSEWVPNQRMVLKAWPEYLARDEPSDGHSGDRTPTLDELVFEFVSDPSTGIQGLITGQYDVLSEAPYDGLEQIAADDDLFIMPSTPELTHLVFSAEREGPFSDVRLRQAVNTGLERDSIMKAAVGANGKYELTHHIMSKFQEGVWNTDVGREGFNSADVEAAKKMIAETGYDGEEITVLITNGYPSAYKASIAVEDQLRKLGFNIKLETQDWSTFVESIYESSEWDAVVMPNSAQMEPSSVWGFLEGAPGQPGTPELNALLEDFNSSTDLEDARSKYDAMQQWREDERWVIRLGDTLTLNAANKAVAPLPVGDRTVIWWKAGFVE